MKRGACLVRIISVLSVASLPVCFKPVEVNVRAMAVETSPSPGIAPVPPLPAVDELPLKDVLFDPNKYNIRPDAEPVLRETAQVLKESPYIDVLIEGYADIRGEEQYNLRLAARRADAAKEYLVKLGIDPKRINTLAKGASTKFSTGSSEEDFQLNRRAHFVQKSPKTGEQTESPSSSPHQRQSAEETFPISNELSRIIEGKLKELAPGQILFNPPREMKVGQSERVNASISGSLIEDLQAGLEKDGLLEGEKIKLGQAMSLQLSGYNFKVYSLSHARQPSRSDGAQWDWEVTPEKSGLHSLLLAATVRIGVNNQAEEEKEYPLYVRAINVKYNPVYSSSRLVKTRWYWIVGALVVLGVIVWTVRRRK
jgi:outer membrane protein OmpA-like peptidoglycan-associated protein